MTTDLSVWLLDRLGEREALAKATIGCSARDWQAKSYRVVCEDEFEVAEAAVPTAAHIAANDPARVLAEVAAVRAVVELLAADRSYEADLREFDILRALAKPYAGSEGWRAEWA